MTVPIIVVPQAEEPSAEARELSEYLQQVIDAYRSDKPEVSDDDVAQALELAQPASTSSTALVGAIAFGIMLLAVLVIGVIAFINRG